MGFQRLQAREVLDKLPTKRLLAKLAGVEPNAHIDTIIEYLKKRFDEKPRLKYTTAAVLGFTGAILWLVSYTLTDKFLEVDSKLKRLGLVLAKQTAKAIDHLLYYIADRLGILLLTRGAVILALSLILGASIAAFNYALSKLFSKADDSEAYKLIEADLRKLFPKSKKLKKVIAFIKQNVPKEALKAAVSGFVAGFTGSVIQFTFSEAIRALVYKILSKLGLREYEWVIAVIVSTIIHLLAAATYQKNVSISVR